MQSPKYTFVFLVPDGRQIQKLRNHTSRRIFNSVFRKCGHDTGVLLNRLYDGTQYMKKAVNVLLDMSEPKQ